MDQIAEMRNLIKDGTIVSRLQRAPSYIQPFLSETVDENIILVYKQLVTQNVTTNRVSVPSCSADFDLSGCPLSYSFILDDYDDTIISGPIKHWHKDEESHGSLSVIKARKILSSCSLHLQCWKLPAWVVCDGSDPQKSVLLSIFHNRNSGWVTRNIVQLLGHWTYKQAEEYAVNMKKEHLSLAKIPGCEVKILMERVYDIQQSGYENPTQSSISVHLSWSSSSFTAVPPDYADAVVEMLVVLEEATSPAEKLWKQLKLLHQLVALPVIFEGKHGADCIELPSLQCNSGNGNRTETADVINLLQEMNYCAMRHIGTTHPTKEPQTTMHLNRSVQQAVSSRSTLYLDFVHHLFLLLSGCRDSENLTNCLLLVFQEVQSGNAKLFIHPRNPTRLAHILRELMRGGSSLPAINGITAIELLIEIGLEKLSKDYTHIFLSSALATSEQLKLSSCRVSERNEAYRNLDVLSRLHVTLEILLQAESEMKFCVSSLQPLAAFCLNNIEALVESLSKLLEVGHVKFKAPVFMKEVKSVLRRRYSSSRMQLTSEGNKCKVYTVLHCSTLPIFPFMSPELTDCGIVIRNLADFYKMNHSVDLFDAFHACHSRQSILRYNLDSNSQLCSENTIDEGDLHCTYLTCLSNKLL